MARTKSKRRRILAWGLGIGGLLVIIFALAEYGLGVTSVETGLDETPSTTETTISDTESGDDAFAVRELDRTESGEGQVHNAVLASTRWSAITSST